MSSVECPGRLALCGVPCGCNGKNPSHRPPGTHCRTACVTRDHDSYGDCLRAAHIGIDKTALAKGRTE